MARKHDSAEKIISLHRGAKILITQGSSVDAAIRQIGETPKTY